MIVLKVRVRRRGIRISKTKGKRRLVRICKHVSVERFVRNLLLKLMVVMMMLQLKLLLLRIGLLLKVLLILLMLLLLLLVLLLQGLVFGKELSGNVSVSKSLTRKVVVGIPLQRLKAVELVVDADVRDVIWMVIVGHCFPGQRSLRSNNKSGRAGARGQSRPDLSAVGSERQGQRLKQTGAETLGSI